MLFLGVGHGQKPGSETWGKAWDAEMTVTLGRRMWAMGDEPSSEPVQGRWGVGG